MEEKTKILIVDDEPINLDFFDVMLSRLGFEVIRAEDGEEALEKVVEHEPDLVLLDNIMPRLSGWEVTRTIKSDEEYEAYRDTPVIMFSAMDDVKDKVEGFELGIEDYIIKPFNFSEVLARIRAVLRHRALSKQVLLKERRIGNIESLNESLIYFSRHLKDPVVKLRNGAENTDPKDPEAVRQFLDAVVSETNEVLAALEGLDEKIDTLAMADVDHAPSELSVKNLEERFQRHFKDLKNENPNVNEVSK